MEDLVDLNFILLIHFLFILFIFLLKRLSRWFMDFYGSKITSTALTLDTYAPNSSTFGLSLF